MKPLPELIKPAKILSKNLEVDMSKCPLFLFENDIPEEFKYICENESTSTNIDTIYEELFYKNLVIPFNEVRMIFNNNFTEIRKLGDIYEKVERKVMSFLFLRKIKCPKTNQNCLSCICQIIGDKDTQLSGAISFFLYPHVLDTTRKAYLHINGFTYKSGDKIAVDLPKGGILISVNKQNDSRHPENTDRMMAAHCAHILYSTIGLLKAIEQKDKRIVEVTPNQNAKKVQWLQGRKHYVILNNSEAINKCSMPEEKFELKLKSSEIITRSAHARRAHTRRLRSPFWKNKIGSTIFVKETWVGPKEWMDKSQSRYRVILDNSDVYSSYAA